MWCCGHKTKHPHTQNPGYAPEYVWRLRLYTDVAACIKVSMQMAIELMFNEDYFMYTMDQNDYLQ